MAKKQDPRVNQELIETLNKSEAFLTKYKKHLLAALVAIIVVVVALILWNNYSKSRNEKASTALAHSQELFMGQDFEKALNGDSLGAPGFKQIANDFSGTKAGNLANLYAGLCLAKQDKWEEAVKYLESFDPKDDLVASPLAIMALGDAYANLKQYEKAVDAFKKAAKMADGASNDGKNNSVSPVALKKAAIILAEQLKKNDEALELFQTIKKEYMNSPLQQDIDKYIEYVSK
ncbi:MAG: tetratricopeptide repeat protein [Prevotella sp.]|nr:tetratricopeptide repeat protein [Prevotella sp.]